MMDAMAYGDDLDARFDELVSQFSQEERNRMRAAATKAARATARKAARGRPAPISRRTRIWLAVGLVVALLAASATVVVVRPDLLSLDVRQASETP